MTLAKQVKNSLAEGRMNLAMLFSEAQQSCRTHSPTLDEVVMEQESRGGASLLALELKETVPVGKDME